MRQVGGVVVAVDGVLPAPLADGAADARQLDLLDAVIALGDFAKIDLRIAKIVDAAFVEGSDKLLRLTLDIGEPKPRNVFSGIQSAYAPHELISMFDAAGLDVAGSWGNFEGEALSFDAWRLILHGVKR